MASSVWRIFRYGETEVDPVIQAEILLESARSQARLAIVMIIVAIAFGVWYGFGHAVFRGVAIFCLITIVPLLIDAALRRRASEKLRGIGPEPAGWKQA